MPNLAEELAHLEQADGHIGIARDSISAIENSAPLTDPVRDGA